MCMVRYKQKRECLVSAFCASTSLFFSSLCQRDPAVAGSRGLTTYLLSFLINERRMKSTPSVQKTKTRHLNRLGQLSEFDLLCVDHLKIAIPTAFAVSRLAWACHYHRATLENLDFSGSGDSDFGVDFGVHSNRGLFRGKSAFEWCRREVQWGARWLERAHVSTGGATAGLVIQVGPTGSPTAPQPTPQLCCGCCLFVYRLLSLFVSTALPLCFQAHTGTARLAVTRPVVVNECYVKFHAIWPTWPFLELTEAPTCHTPKGYDHHTAVARPVALRTQARCLSVQCGLAENDFSNAYSAEKIDGGAAARPCAVANATHPATAHAASLAGALAAAAVLFWDGTGSERREAETWLQTAQEAQVFAATHVGTALDWFVDVRCPLACAAMRSKHCIGLVCGCAPPSCLRSDAFEALYWTGVSMLRCSHSHAA